jgi:hypothetical protein
MASLDDALELYTELKRLKREVRTANVGDEVESEEVEGIKLEGAELAVKLVGRVTKKR